MKQRIITCIALSLALLAATAPLAATPSAQLQGNITEYSREADGTHFTVEVLVSAPTEDYAALDFTLASADHERLFIEEIPDSDSEKNLSIEFPRQYGNAYHNGRLNEATGAFSHLIGIFSPSGQNDIREATTVCSVSMVYTGGEPVDLSLEDLQLVYMEEDNTVASVKLDSGFTLPISAALFQTVPPEQVPQAFPPTADDSAFPILPVVLSAVLAAAAGAGVTAGVMRRRKRT
ncbi:MAG: hypothetical protein LBQ16_06355 [Gracilibacteraceae bacterium]|nr:hypothetical protein [Gracilibacteraceae bacterium]